jgi:hypothetical protein
VRGLGGDDVVAAESAIAAVQPALQAVREPGYQRLGHYALGMLYGQRVPGDRSENLERAIGCLRRALAATSSGSLAR